MPATRPVSAPGSGILFGYGSAAATAADKRSAAELSQRFPTPGALAAPPTGTGYRSRRSEGCPVNISQWTIPHADNAMSALDQAIIKAYAKDRPAAASSVAGPAAPSLSRPLERRQRQTTGQKVDQLYRDGSLYRLETPAATQPVPMPHLPSLPPTSPRRGVRRSMQRLLAANAAAIEEEQPAEPPRVARKVIIRHIANRGSAAFGTTAANECCGSGGANRL